MTVFWGLLFIIFSASASEPCLTANELSTTVSEFKIKVEPLLNTFPLPTEIVYKDIPLLADEHVNGYTDIMDKSEYHIVLSGAQCDEKLYRDEIKLLLCHELGHLAGGVPYMTFIGHEKQIVSAEGQADYFATSSCLPAIFAGDDNTPSLKEAESEPELKNLCAEGDDQARGLCMRILKASLNFTRFVNKIPKDMSPHEVSGAGGANPELAGKDPRVVTKTLTREYPSAQCRLQTMIAGFQCQAKQLLSNFSQNDKTELSCGEFSAAATRPTCWYVP